MTDRELLELAARAAGYDVVRMDDEEEGLLLYGVQDSWNPLADDDDALRLAVKLGITFDIHYNKGTAPDESVAWGKTAHIERHIGDPYAATRRAIVRAAAEIGKEMK